MKKILIIQTAFLGDVILITPLIEELKRIDPNIHIDILIRKGNEALLANHPLLRKLLIWDKTTKKYAHLFQLLKQIRTEKYDEVIGVQRFFSSGFLTGLSGAKHRVGFKKNPLSFLFTQKKRHKIGDGEHEVQRNLSLIAHHKGVQPILKPVLYPSVKDEEKVQAYKKDEFYCIAPTSVWFTKQMTQDKWEELMKYLGKNHVIYLIGGPNDKITCERFKKALPDFPIINLAGELSLLESAALMRDAKRNYVNDSGPLHIASAMNAKVTAFFCSTIPAFGFGPLSDDSQIIETKERLDCRPCGLHGFKACPEKHFKCNYQIEVQQSKR